jgi:hypothetical protein
MSLDKAIQHGKEKRKQYYGSQTAHVGMVELALGAWGIGNIKTRSVKKRLTIRLGITNNFCGS